MMESIGDLGYTLNRTVGSFKGSIRSRAPIVQNETPFIGPLDALQSQGATFLYVGSSHRLLTSYTGNAYRLQGNGTGSPEAEIAYLANGKTDLAAAAAIAAQDGGTGAFGVTWYGQVGGINATQTVASNRMKFSTAMNSNGGWGDGVDVALKFLNLNLDIIAFPMYVSAVVKTSASGNRTLLGTVSTFSNRLMRTSSGAMGQNWGSSMAGTANEVSDGLHVLGYLANGASSKHFLDGSLILTGDPNTSQTNMVGGRIGSDLSAANGWLNRVNTGIFEIVIFSCDPTGLAGWSTFQADQLARFS